MVPVPRDERIIKRIIAETSAFWRTVLQARKLITKRDYLLRDGDIEMAQEIYSHVCSLEPEPDTSKAYEKYYSEKFLKITQEPLPLNEDISYLIYAHDRINTAIKMLSSQKQLIRNTLTKHHVEQSVERFGVGSRYSKYATRGSTNTHSLTVKNQKEGIDEKDLKDNFIKMNLIA